MLLSLMTVVQIFIVAVWAMIMLAAFIVTRDDDHTHDFHESHH